MPSMSTIRPLARRDGDIKKAGHANASPAFFPICSRYSGGERLDSLVQPALVAGGFVLGDYTLVDHAVDDRDRRFIRACRSILVAGIACLDDVLDLSSHLGAQAHVVLAGLFRLACAFAS